MAIDLTSVRELVWSILNSSIASYGTNADTKFHPQGEIDDAALNADHQVVAAILDTKGHRHRRKFVESLVVTNGAIITESFEGGVTIDGRPGKPVSPGTLNRLAVNPNSNLTQTGYYCVQGNIIHFLGSACSIDIMKYTATSSLQAPDEYIMAVVAGTLAQVFPKEGAYLGGAGHFAGLFNQCLGLIRSGVTTLPAITPFNANGN